MRDATDQTRKVPSKRNSSAKKQGSQARQGEQEAKATPGAAERAQRVNATANSRAISDQPQPAMNRDLSRAAGPPASTKHASGRSHRARARQSRKAA
jgi:hypothetical protein